MTCRKGSCFVSFFIIYSAYCENQCLISKKIKKDNIKLPVSPMEPIGKLHTLGLTVTLGNWILDFIDSRQSPNSSLKVTDDNKSQQVEKCIFNDI